MKQIQMVDGPTYQGYVVIVDDEDYERMSQWRWNVQPGKQTMYARRSEGSKRFLMHREIMDAPDDMQVDHINGNGLDNRRENLRLVTPHANNFNRRVLHGSTPYAGICFLDSKKNPRYAKNDHKPYKAHITVKGHRINLGFFATLDEAVAIRDRAALHYFGELALLVHPDRLEEYRATPYQPRQHRQNKPRRPRGAA